jgi:hypothetical protein
MTLGLMSFGKMTLIVDIQKIDIRQNLFQQIAFNRMTDNEQNDRHYYQYI